MEIFVTGKQWMWKVEHPEGQREINELHVPLGRPVKLTMTSEDVIHDFFVPAFRVKKDVLPGRYTSCGLRPPRPASSTCFARSIAARSTPAWSARSSSWSQTNTSAGSTAKPRERRWKRRAQNLFQERGCATCHLADGTGRGPSLLGVFGQPVRLATGAAATANDAYLREAILTPSAKSVPGYTPTHAVVSGTAHRRADSRPDRLHPLAAGRRKAKP